MPCNRCGTENNKHFILQFLYPLLDVAMNPRWCVHVANCGVFPCRIYGDKAPDIIDGIKKNPVVAVPLVLRR